MCFDDTGKSCPGGTSDNSPTFQRWDLAPTRNKSRGTADGVHSQPSLRDLHPVCCGFPTLKRWAIIGHPFGMMSGKFLVALDFPVRNDPGTFYGSENSATPVFCTLLRTGKSALRSWCCRRA